MGILIVDIDYFKRINDTRGHAVGDYALREVASSLQREGHFLLFPTARAAKFPLFFSLGRAIDDDDLSFVQLHFFRPLKVDFTATCQNSYNSNSHPFANLAKPRAQRFPRLFQKL